VSSSEGSQSPPSVNNGITTTVSVNMGYRTHHTIEFVGCNQPSFHPHLRIETHRKASQPGAQGPLATRQTTFQLQLHVVFVNRELRTNGRGRRVSPNSSGPQAEADRLKRKTKVMKVQRKDQCARVDVQASSKTNEDMNKHTRVS
jgi:hypothetical protein